MDNLVLIRVAASLQESLAGATVADIRVETAHRRRMLFERDGRPLSLLVSLDPVRPWVGRPIGRWEGPRRGPDRFLAGCLRDLEGRPVRRVIKPTQDRVLRIDFAGGAALVVELVTHRANLVLLDSAGRVSGSARRPRSCQERLEPGATYEPPRRPRGIFDPLGASPDEIDRAIAGVEAGGESRFETLRRHFFGLGTEAARLIVEEAARSGVPEARVLASRLDRLLSGTIDPVVLAVDDPSGGGAAVADVRLLPWDLPGVWPELRRFERSDPTATAGLFYDTLEREAILGRRRSDLIALIQREIRQLHETEARVRADLDGFDDPDRHRLRGEALLAGLRQARRHDDGIAVPDPYSADGAEIIVPARPGTDPRRVADQQFQAHRRAIRGLERARRRLDDLCGRRERIEKLAVRAQEGTGGQTLSVDEIEREMRRAGMPVGLEPETRRGAAFRRVNRARLEGVRIFSARDGTTILVGKGARDNHRLTFRFAAPEDFWFHASDHRGAHVVLRNEERRATPPEEALLEAAALAAWYSDARDQPRAEVRWTRRKFVRHPRGAPPGMVILKRFQTVDVRPSPGSDPSAHRGRM